MPGKWTTFISDTAGLIMIGVGFYLLTRAGQYLFTSLILLIVGLASLSLTRRAHTYLPVAMAARHISTYAPTAVILTLVAVALSDFASHFTRVDFGMFYASALQLRSDPAHLYDVTIQNQVLRLVTGDLEYHYLSFPYPPFVAALFVPLTYLSFHSAYFIMLGCNLILLASTVYFLSKSLCRTRDQVQAIILAGSMLLPIYINLILGQMAFVGLLLYSLFIIDILKKKDTRAGLWAAFLSYKLMLVPIPFLILLLRRAWKGMSVAIFVMILLAGFSLALVGANGISGNLYVMKMMTNDSLIPRMQSIRALAYYLGFQGEIYWLCAALALGALWLVARRNGGEKWILAAAVLANLLVSPYVQIYDVSLCLIAVALVVSALPEMSLSKRASLLLWAFLPGFISVAGQVAGRNWPAIPVGLLIMFFYCLLKATNQPQTPQNQLVSSICDS